MASEGVVEVGADDIERAADGISRGGGLHSAAHSCRSDSQRPAEQQSFPWSSWKEPGQGGLVGDVDGFSSDVLLLHPLPSWGTGYDDGCGSGGGSSRCW